MWHQTPMVLWHKSTTVICSVIRCQVNFRFRFISKWRVTTILKRLGLSFARLWTKIVGFQHGTLVWSVCICCAWHIGPDKAPLSTIILDFQHSLVCAFTAHGILALTQAQLSTRILEFQHGVVWAFTMPGTLVLSHTHYQQKYLIFSMAWCVHSLPMPYWS